MMNFLKSLQFIFRPSFWLMNEPYSPAHDALLNKLMDEHDFSDVGSHEAKLGSVYVWISNYPYGVGLYDMSHHSRPSRLTILRMWKKLAKDIVKNYNK